MKPLAILFISLFLASATTAWARGGGGCFEAGTPVLTPTGPVAIEQLRVGDEVIGGRVEAVTRVEPTEYLELAGSVHVTAGHPFEIAPGIFRTAERVFPQARRIPAKQPAYNLLVSPGGRYFVERYIVHNKGCFLPDTPILRANGSCVAISEVRPGDKLLAFDPAGAIETATVRNVITHEVNEYLIVRTDRVELRVTVEHPFYVGDDTFETLEALKPGDAIFAFDGRGLTAQPIISLERIRERTRVYNLQTDAPNTFFANGIAVHNKGGGCFPAGTPVRTPTGTVAIEQVRPGDVVLSGQGGWAIVEATFVTRARVLTVMTDAGRLHTTAEHPLLCRDGRFRLAGDLACGDLLVRALPYSHVGAAFLPRFLAAGRDRNVAPTEPVVTGVATGEEQLAYNLRVSAPHTFVAGGFVVHNKGGGGGGSRGGGGYHGRSGGSGRPMTPAERRVMLFVMGGVIVIVIIAKVSAARRGDDENLDFSYSRSAVDPKAEKTRKLLEFIARTDLAWESEKLQQTATEVFVKLQECWQARDYEPMRPLMMPDLCAQHVQQLAGLRRNHEINMIDESHVDRVDIVNVRYTHQENQREFTALITATARDYYIDDRTQEVLRGDDAPAQFQEFWTFQRQDGKWLLREIEQTRESDVLKEENFFEQFTDKGVEQVYGVAAGKEGAAGPWLEKGVETKATRIERLLNFLVQTDKLWDRQAMLERSRQVFMDVYLARENGTMNDGDLFPEVAASLHEEIARRQQAGSTLEFRNLCVRKAELVLVHNYTDNTRDEFTVRISAHAQRFVKQGGAVVGEDEYVTPFVEYWTFGRLDNQWKLKEVLPEAQGEGLVGQENIDEDSSKDQLQWYYRQTRAN